MPLTLRPGLTRCPAHQDRRHPSLSITRTPEGRWLLHCFAGCDTADILKAAGMTWADLDPNRPQQPPARPTRPRTAQQEAWSEVLARERHARAKRAEYALEHRASDRMRQLQRLADLLRGFATRLGEESDMAWDLLSTATRLEIEAGKLEAAMDDGLVL